MTIPEERLDDRDRTKLSGLLAAGDPRGEVPIAWHCTQAMSEIYTTGRPRTSGGDRGTARCRSPGRLRATTNPSPRPHDRPLVDPDHELAPQRPLQRTHPSDQHPHQTHQARRIRVPPVLQLPHPCPPPRHLTQLGPTRHPHPRQNPMSHYWQRGLGQDMTWKTIEAVERPSAAP